MQSIHIELPDTLAAELDALVQAGWFRNKNELICLALVEFARRHRVALAEQFQQEDIACGRCDRKRPRRSKTRRLRYGTPCCILEKPRHWNCWPEQEKSVCR